MARLSLSIDDAARRNVLRLSNARRISVSGMLRRWIEERLGREMQREAERRPVQAHVAHTHLAYWSTALARQRERCLRSGRLDAHQQIDHDLYAYCLAQLLTAAELCQRFDGSIQMAIRSFNRVVPAARHIRDVITHFDAYEQGIGLAQRAKG